MRIILCLYLWQFGLCHTFNLGNTGEQLATSTSNQKELGLNLFLDIENKEYYGFDSYLSTGIKVAVHDQKEYPKMEHSGNDVMPGFTTYIKIKKKMVFDTFYDIINDMYNCSFSLLFDPSILFSVLVLLSFSYLLHSLFVFFFFTFLSL